MIDELVQADLMHLIYMDSRIESTFFLLQGI